MELDPSRDKHLPVLSELEAEEPFLLSPTLTFCFCIRRCTWAAQAKTSLFSAPAVRCTPRNGSKKNILST